MANKVINSYWNGGLDIDDCFIACLGDVHKEPNLTVAREVEYHPDNDKIVIVDVFWDDNGSMAETHSINPKTLKYYEEECKVQPNITMQEYNDIVSEVKRLASEN